jgi:hypothetical protein
VYDFGAGCAAGYRQGTFFGTVGATQEPVLAKGYALATSTLNIFGNGCDPTVSAETLSRVKAYFVERHGMPIHTIGQGRSGGAMQQYLIAQSYPGLLDGIVVSGSFPDHTTYLQSATDCALLDRAFDVSTLRWSDEQKAAVSGFATWATCLTALKWAPLDARNCDPSIPKHLVYDAATNPRGVRCTIHDNQINSLGRDPRTGFARRPLDNVGVQYGLVAFNSGAITADQFIELNENIGGYDVDGNIVALRTVADVEAVRRAYERGLVMTGGDGLSRIPIIDWRIYTDDQGDNHDRFRSLVARARLIAANGHADNQAMLVDAPALGFYMAFYVPADFTDAVTQRSRSLVMQMDGWLNNIAADGRPGANKVVRNRPADLQDGCWQVDGKRMFEPVLDGRSGRCGQMYPVHADPRVAAGGPLTDDVLKCALKPVDPADYTQLLQPSQLERLQALYPEGVCDFGRPGIGQGVTAATRPQ